MTRPILDDHNPTQWQPEHCRLVTHQPDNGAIFVATAEFDGAGQSQCFGIQSEYFYLSAGETLVVTLQCRLTQLANVDDVFLLIREFRPGGQLNFQVQRSISMTALDLYLTCREQDMIIQPAILFRTGGSGPAAAKISISAYSCRVA